MMPGMVVPGMMMPGMPSQAAEAPSTQAQAAPSPPSHPALREEAKAASAAPPPFASKAVSVIPKAFKAASVAPAPATAKAASATPEGSKAPSVATAPPAATAKAPSMAAAPPTRPKESSSAAAPPSRSKASSSAACPACEKAEGHPVEGDVKFDKPMTELKPWLIVGGRPNLAATPQKLQRKIAITNCQNREECDTHRQECERMGIPFLAMNPNFHRPVEKWAALFRNVQGIVQNSCKRIVVVCNGGPPQVSSRGLRPVGAERWTLCGSGGRVYFSTPPMGRAVGDKMVR